MSGERDSAAIARKGRHVAVVIAATMLLWLLANALGPVLGLPGRYALLFDLAALAGFVYALVNILQLWRMRQDRNRG